MQNGKWLYKMVEKCGLYNCQLRNLKTQLSLNQIMKNCRFLLLKSIKLLGILNLQTYKKLSDFVLYILLLSSCLLFNNLSFRLSFIQYTGNLLYQIYRVKYCRIKVKNINFKNNKQKSLIINFFILQKQIRFLTSQSKMKSYFKSITKSLYQKVQRVVEDEYIQPITQTQIYSIINCKQISSKNHLTKSSKYHRNQSSSDIDGQNVLDIIERLTLVTPERQFKLVGDNYSLEIINYRLKQLKTKSESVKEHMLSSYGKNLECIEMALMQIEDVRNINKSREKSIVLKEKINKLNQLVSKTMKITKLNIKLKNIKNVLKITQKIPNVMKMTLFELKNINLNEINAFKQSIQKLNNKNTFQSNFQIQKLQATIIDQSNNQFNSAQQSLNLSSAHPLKCIQHLQYFIDKVSSQHLRLIISSITQCLTQIFQSQKYQKAIKNFIISKSTHQFSKLLSRLIQSEIRDKIQDEIKNSQDKNGLFLRCQRYITILINVFKIFRWHRYNLAVIDASQETQQKMRARNSSVVSNCSQKSQDKYPVINLDTQVSIKIHTEQIKNHICGLMDQCFKQQIQELLFNDSAKNEEIFEMLTLINQFYQIAFSFSSYIFIESKNQIQQILMRKVYKLHQKGLRQFNQALNIQEGNQWNRLPVLRNFRYRNIQRNIEKVKKLSLYQKVPELICQNFKFLNIDYCQDNEEIFQLEAVQQKQDTFELIEFKFPNQKFQKMQSFQINDSPLPQHQDPEVVLCQSSTSILNYFDQFLSMYLYFPIQEIRNDILDKMSFYIQYYIYYTFETFLSEMYRKFFFQSYETIEQQYLQVRTKKIYQNISKFLDKFQKKQSEQLGNNINKNKKYQQRQRKSSVQIRKYRERGYSFIKKQIKQTKISQQNGVKARAMATDSIKFVLAYFKHILLHLEKYTAKTTNQKDEKKPQKYIQKYKIKIEQLKCLQSQMSDLLLTDNIPATTKVDFVIPIIKKIKWHQIQGPKQLIEFSQMILKNIKQVYDKMRSVSKGQIPFYVVDRMFSFYWKTQLTYMTKAFLDEHIAHKQRGGKTSKLAFQKLIDTMYQELIVFLDERYRGKELSNGSSKIVSYEITQKRIQQFKQSYLKIKNIFPILLESKWTICKQKIQKSLKSFDFIYKITISIMKASECCSGLSPNEIQNRQNQIDEFIKAQILK